MSFFGYFEIQVPTKLLNTKATHPYTQALLASKPSLDPTDRKRSKPLQGDVPSPLNPPLGCHFHPRCPEAMESETSSIAYRTGMATTFRSRNLHTLPSGIVLCRRTEVVLMLLNQLCIFVFEGGGSNAR